MGKLLFVPVSILPSDGFFGARSSPPINAALNKVVHQTYKTTPDWFNSHYIVLGFGWTVSYLL
ncbi:hypothetical protein EWB00_009008 [Schistosoma japonicum]|uniref:Uncharacterized protein n=1 Tax=Schistosoma japonicum TaxID=6182 RepID=A0A4Z2CN87_SCHJA|nr:hypothetical protein EWB00_009008 [Schistosoma japonicum]